MGFFKKLKERLFTLNLDQDEPKEQKSIKKTKVKKEVKQDKALIKQRKKQKTLNKYVAGLKKSSISFSEKIKELQSRHNQIDEPFFEELEELLIMSDISLNLVENIIYEIKKEVKKENIKDLKLINEIIADKMFVIYTNNSVVNTNLNIEDNRLNIILMVGVNGSGKTTSIGKIANKFVQEGKKVLIAAGDTFRAGAVAQLDIWAQKVNASIVKPIKENADPASVVYDALDKAISEKFDILIIDTAGRLQNKVNLMNELAKINSILQKKVPQAPHESLLVLDATTGQNGVLQAKSFKEVTPLTGIVLTKMDGTSKGGIVLSIKDDLNLNVKLVGLGEKMDDLQEFNLDAFIFGMMEGIINES